MTARNRRVLALATALLLVVAACASDDSTESSDGSGAPSSTTVVEDGSLNVREMVEALDSDEFEGRDNDMPGSVAAQELLVEEISRFTDPAFPEAEGNDGYLQPYGIGTNVLGVVPGGELADEYVMIGAHYDHLGFTGSGGCKPDPDDPDDEICNGATDNATGVAAAIDIVKSIAADGPPRRTVILALWGGEEDDFDGSITYTEEPVAPLDETIAYVNFDIQGANLLPSLAGTTIMVGAETGGPNLIESAAAATEASTLDTAGFSLLFGQGRSDHAVFAEEEMPVVFFTDATTGCHHTVKDDLDAVDFDKLDQQILTADALSRDLIATDTPPVYDGDAPATTFQDASELLRVITSAEPDFDLLTPEEAAQTEQFLGDLQDVVDAGEDVFDDSAEAVLLGGAVNFVSAMAAAECDPGFGE
jgi:hypothetical protein